MCFTSSIFSFLLLFSLTLLTCGRLVALFAPPTAVAVATAATAAAQHAAGGDGIEEKGEEDEIDERREKKGGEQLTQFRSTGSSAF